MTFCQFKKKGLLGNVSFFGEFSHCDDQKKIQCKLYNDFFSGKILQILPYFEGKKSHFAIFRQVVLIGRQN